MRYSFKSALSILLSSAIAISPLHAAASPLAAILDKTKSVVSIEAIDAVIYSGQPDGAFDPSTGQIIVIQPIRQVSATQTGGGIIIDERGVIVTNTHTVRDSPNIFVTLFDGTRLPAKLLHQVPDEDISFIQINPPFALSAIPFGDSDKLAISSDVYALVHSNILNGSLSGGQIQSLGRKSFNGTPHVTLLQISFRVYRGDSGSPIFDRNGHFLGMINAGQTQGDITFAIAAGFIGSCYNNYLQSL